jgi:hypothetical protein
MDQTKETSDTNADALGTCPECGRHHYEAKACWELYTVSHSVELDDTYDDNNAQMFLSGVYPDSIVECFECSHKGTAKSFQIKDTAPPVLDIVEEFYYTLKTRKDKTPLELKMMVLSEDLIETIKEYCKEKYE